MQTNNELKVYYPYFDYVRFMAASVVMFFHADLITFSQPASVAVDVFFALSGWLIGSILININTTQLPKFYFNRAVRIWIPYLVALLLIVCVSLIKDPIDSKWFEFVFYKLTFVYNIFGPPQLAEWKDYMPLDGTGNHFWSVNAEEQFYLLAPILLVVLWRWGRLPITWGILSILTWYYQVYPPIFLGVTAALIAKNYGAFHKHILAKTFLIIVLTLSLFAMLFGDDYRLYSPAFSISLILLLAVEGRKSEVGVFMGGISYPLYLNHWIGIFAANLLLGAVNLRDTIYSALLAIVIGYIVACILYVLVDKPCLENRAKFFTVRRGISAMAIAYLSVIIGLIYGYLHMV